eukprot:11383433-Prorocentrum_lima.AAC.1
MGVAMEAPVCLLPIADLLAANNTSRVLLCTPRLHRCSGISTNLAHHVPLLVGHLVRRRRIWGGG